MHENFLKLQRIGEILPELINRLECLKFIHEESVNVNDNIEKIKNNKEEINNNLQSSNSLINQVININSFLLNNNINNRFVLLWIVIFQKSKVKSNS